MKRLRTSRRFLIIAFLGAALPAVFLTGVAYLQQTEVTWHLVLIRYLVFLTVLLASPRASPQPTAISSKYRWPWMGVVSAYLGAIASLGWLFFDSTAAAWITLVAFFVFMIGVARLLTSQRHLIIRGLLHVLIVGTAGAVPVILVQLNARFAEEEFFVALQVIVLSFAFALTLVVDRIFFNRRGMSTSGGWRLDRPTFTVVMILFGLLGSLGIVRAYQRSFYSDQVPDYPGISRHTPFICDQTPPDSQVTYDGQDVYRRLLALVARNPRKQPPEFGMLALGTGDPHWASEFRTSILEEAKQNRFAQPANSVKFIQYEAALRAYYYPRMCTAFPDLFTHQEKAQVREWFAEINRRAFTVEWVDGLYAVAFSQWPSGPYENQENGAGLLALLESEDLAAPELRAKNQRYLAENPRGWQQRFHNTDDALVYQLEWLNNAYFQSLYAGIRPEKNLRLSFEWLLLQALPDGAPMGYNHLAEPSLAGIAYMGAVLLEDPRYIWLAGRAIEALETKQGYLSAQPGVEAVIDLIGHPPAVGSCLLYSDSGLPNQRGPLAPDKVVLRDGWTEDARYLLLNLRFTGWHRYKATNTLTRVYQNGNVIQDVTEGDAFDWLPVGRSLFRDKRIPRENLNGLVIARSGLSAVLQKLTGIGSPWAQDPPHYASVEAFEVEDERDIVHTRLDNWHGWQHDRWIYFYKNQEPMVIFDEAHGPSGSKGAFYWHFANPVEVMDGRFTVSREGASHEIFLLVQDWETGELKDVNGATSLQQSVGPYVTSVDGQLRLITVILPESWHGASVKVNQADGCLEIATEHGELTVPLPAWN